MEAPISDEGFRQIATWMYRGYSLLEAAAKAGVRAPGRREFAHAMTRIAQGATGQAWKVINFAAEAGFHYAGSFARKAAYRIGVLGASAATTGVLIGVIAGAVVLGVGGYIYVKSADKPILPGPAMNKEKPEAKAGPAVTYNVDDYFVFLLPEVSGGSIYVGQESQLKTMHTCDMPGGGVCGDNDPPLKYEAKSAGFKSYDDATKAWCAELKGKELHNHPVAGDASAKVYGGDYWIGTAPSCSQA